MTLAYTLLDDGTLTNGFLHFPSGCAGTVLVRVTLLRQGHGAIEPLTPINGFIALDNSSWEFILEEDVKRDDEILVDIENFGQAAHTVSTVITHWYRSPTQKETETKTRGRLRFVAPGRTPIREERRNE